MIAIESDIAALETARAAAIVSADLDCLAAMVTDDYIHVDADGAERGKTGYLAAIKSPAGYYAEYRLIENIIELTGDLAIVRGRFENRLQASDGSIRSKSARHIRLYRLHEGSWRNFYHQATLIDPAQA